MKPGSAETTVPSASSTSGANTTHYSPKLSSNRQLLNEIVLGRLAGISMTGFVNQWLMKLPQYNDDLERDFGIDIYERMMNDYAVSSSMDALREHVVSAQSKLIGRVAHPMPTDNNPTAAEDYIESENCRLWWEGVLDSMNRPIESIVANMIDALCLGHKVLEKCCALNDQGEIYPTALKVKPRRAYGFVTDQYNNLVGLVAAKTLTGGIMSNLQDVISIKDVEPVDKFVIFTFDPVNDDPRGSSILRSAYAPWLFKQRGWPSWMLHLDKWGVPSVAAILGEDSAEEEPVTDPSGAFVTDGSGDPTTIPANEAMLMKLLDWGNGRAVVLDPGTELQVVQNQGSGDVFPNTFNFLDKAIVRVILKTVRATMESEFGSRADSGTAENILARFADRVRLEIEVLLYRSVLYFFTERNWGTDYANRYTPILALDSKHVDDVVGYGNMIANLGKSIPGIIDVSQFVEIWQALRLPRGDIQKIINDIQEQKEQQAQQQQQQNELHRMSQASG